MQKIVFIIFNLYLCKESEFKYSFRANIKLIFLNF